MKLLNFSTFSPFRTVTELIFILVVFFVFLGPQSLFATEGDGVKLAQASPQPSPPPKTRTIVADLLMIDGGFYVVRGERGEIRIEVTPETQLAESFTFGDRIKAVLLPDDKAIAITRAQPGEPIGTTSKAPVTPAPPSPPSPGAKSKPFTPPTKVSPNVRIIIADILMVDGNFYIIRSDYGEIQIEVTPQTQLSESFRFGDRIKARVTPQDQALSIVRASPDDFPGIRVEEGPLASTPTKPPVVIAPETEPTGSKKDTATTAPKVSPKVRTIVAEILMIDGNLYVVRGDRGEIRIEVTAETALSESFQFGDRIKAKILPNDTALSIERARPDEALGTQTP
jgi:exosome complex RNA-binding protein Csl4